ncbi:hypothetical protein D3C76_515800 [compost metagenome]
MSFNVTIVAFGREPDYSDEKILGYRGFDPALIGKPTAGPLHFWKVKTEIPEANILHVQTRDANVNSPNMALVFENAFPPGLTEDSPFLHRYQERFQVIISETMLRLQVHDQRQVEGPWFFEGVIAFTFLDVQQAISDDLALAERNEILKRN